MTRSLSDAITVTRPMKVGLIGITVICLAWLGYTQIIKKSYLEPRAAALARIEDANAKLAQYRTYREDHPRIDKQLRHLIDRTLGGNLETVDHTLRSRLRRAAEQAGLDPKSIAVDTSKTAKPVESPAKSTFSGPANRQLREELDFLELEGWVSGIGSFPQVLALIDSIEAEPWIKRIDQIKLDPSDNGERFSVNVRLTTLFLPGKSPDPKATLTVSRPGPERFSALASVNPFRIPPADARPANHAAGPATFPYQQWAVTGIAQSFAGTEVWLLNTTTRESRRLGIGEKFKDLTLIAAKGEIAEFTQGAQRFIVRVGQNLGDRSAVKQ